MRITAVLIATVLAMMSMAGFAQGTKQPEAGERPAAKQGDADQERSGASRNEKQTQPQTSTGPIETRSGGTSPASPQGDTPPGMQAVPQEPSPQSGGGSPSTH
jgi:hypothetical protein